jgi:hypothetical protein
LRLQLLVRRFKAASLLLDGDEAGQKAAEELLVRPGRQMWVQAPILGNEKQPDMLSAEELHHLLEEKIRARNGTLRAGNDRHC